VGVGFTPFGIVAVNDDRTIFRLVPISASLREGTRFEQSQSAPVLQDRRARKFMFALPERVSRQQLLEALNCSALPGGPVTVTELALPGVKLRLGKVTVQFDEGRVTFTLRED
jgi:hypothetical protein